MKKCEYCEKEYVKNNSNFIKKLSEAMKKRLEYIPSCDCYEKKIEEEIELKELELSKQRKINRIKKFKDISILDKKIESANFENAEMNKHLKICKSYAEKFLEKKLEVGILLYGSVGTGKTYASSCIANYLMKNNKTVMIMNLGLYLNKLKREWAEAEADVLNYAKECQLLIIDDFGTEKVSEFVLEKVFNLIDTRYRAEKPLIITSNLNLDEIEERFGSRISDRIKDMCYPIMAVGESKRGISKEKFREIFI